VEQHRGSPLVTSLGARVSTGASCGDDMCWSLAAACWLAAACLGLSVTCAGAGSSVAYIRHRPVAIHYVQVQLQQS
jgi:hypothetical protein